MTYIVKILLLSTYLFTSVSGDQIVLHLCQDGACAEMSSDCDGSCCGDDEQESSEKGCCDDVVINVSHQHFATTETSTQTSLDVQAVIPEVEEFSPLNVLSFICDKQKTNITSPQIEARFQQHFRIRQLVFYA